MSTVYIELIVKHRLSEINLIIYFYNFYRAYNYYECIKNDCGDFFQLKYCLQISSINYFNFSDNGELHYYSKWKILFYIYLLIILTYKIVHKYWK